jgi:outer membrane protein TolC
LKVKLGIDDANQGVREIQEKEEFLDNLLAEAIGEKDRVIPQDLPESLPTVVEVRTGSPQSRSDIQALGKQIEATELQAKAAGLSYVPRIEAFAGYMYLKQQILTQNNWGDFGVRLTWAVFDGGVGSAKSSALSRERSALESRKESATSQIAAQADDAQRMLTIKRQEYLERLQAVEEARRASDIDFKRLRQGKVTVSDVVDAADLLKDREEKAALSKVNWYEGWYRYQSATGSELSVPR